MVVLALDLAVIATVAFCGWRGYKNGLIRGVFGVVSLIVSLFIANIAASAYSGEFKDMLDPFVGGFVDSALGTLSDGAMGDAENDTGAANAGANSGTTGSGSASTSGGTTGNAGATGSGSASTSGAISAGSHEGDDSAGDDDSETTGGFRNIEYDLSAVEGAPIDIYTAYDALRSIGLPESPALRVAEMAAEDSGEAKTPTGILSGLVSDKLSSAIAYAVVFGIAFILLAIIFTVIGNLIGFVFSLPGLKLIDKIAGVAFGIIKGLIVVYALAAVIRYVGILAPGTLDSTSILKQIVNNNPIANRIGI